MTGRRRAPAQLLGAALVVGGLVVACAPHEGGQPGAGAVTAAGGEATAELRLGLTEWSIETGGAVLLPGQVRVRVTNAGGTSHDVVIHGERGSWESPVLGPGESHDMVITTVAGEELDLICTLTGHHVQGMHTTIDVVEER